MANELRVVSVTGLTPTVQLYSGGTPIGPPITMTEIAGTGVYYGSMPTNLAYNNYIVICTAGSLMIAAGEILWDGANEVNKSLGLVQGLDKLNPATTTPSLLSAGNVQMAITGDGISSTTLTRQ